MRFRHFADGSIVSTTSDVELALALISVEGVLDLAWGWSVVPTDGGWRIGVTFNAPDRDTKFMAFQQGRDFHVQNGATVGAVVKTAFVAIKLALEHELLEAFKVGGYRPFDPHAPVVPA